MVAIVWWKEVRNNKVCDQGTIWHVTLNTRKQISRPDLFTLLQSIPDFPYSISLRKPSYGGEGFWVYYIWRSVELGLTE